MPYGVVIDVPAPVEMYDALHTAIVGRSGASIDGLLFHLGRTTSDGFQVIEVWESREHYDRYNDELVRPVVTELSGGQVPPPSNQTTEEFEVRGLVIPRGGVLL